MKFIFTRLVKWLFSFIESSMYNQTSCPHLFVLSPLTIVLNQSHVKGLPILASFFTWLQRTQMSPSYNLPVTTATGGNWLPPTNWSFLKLNHPQPQPSSPLLIRGTNHRTCPQKPNYILFTPRLVIKGPKKWKLNPLFSFRFLLVDLFKIFTLFSVLF